MQLKVLLSHNFYQQRAGEASVFFSEKALLEANGHKVITYTRDNQELFSYPLWRRLIFPANTLWSFDTSKEINDLISHKSPDIAHFHNTFPLISPSAYATCKARGLPVIQSLHNYRLLCPSAILYRNNRICEDCLGRMLPWPGIIHACYRSSRLQTSLVSANLALHNFLQSWQRYIDIFIVSNEFTRRKYIEGGFPSRKIVIKPHFVFPDPGLGEPNKRDPNFLFIGRLSAEKGINTLLRAWRFLDQVQLFIIGDGPLHSVVTDTIIEHAMNNINQLGHIQQAQLIKTLKRASALIVCSENYENFPRVIIEAFACGVPVIVPRLGSMAEVVQDGINGIHYEPSSPEDLAVKVKWAQENINELHEMGVQARQTYEKQYSIERNYELLLAIYKRSIRDGIKQS